MEHLKLYEDFKKDLLIKPDVELEFPNLRQIYNFDCGACALQQVLVYYGIEKRESELMSKLATKKTSIIEHGTKLSKIKDVAEYYGLKAEVKKNCTIKEIKKLIDEGVPPILLIQAWRDFSKDTDWKKDYHDGHYVVCFTKDTKVSLLDGRNLNFEELINEYENKSFWVYSYDINLKQIVPGMAHSPRKTGIKQKIIKITLDNNEEIKCTLNHPFLKRNFEYTEAKDLKIGDSLMPLYKKISNEYLNGYEMIFDVESQKWEYTHRIVMKENLKNSDNKNTVHHKDFNKLNNTPENLQLMTANEHFIFHARLAKNLIKYSKSDKGRNKSKELMIEHWKDIDWRKKMIEITKNNLLKGKIKLIEEQRCGFQAWDKEELCKFNSETALKNENWKNLQSFEAKEKCKQTQKYLIENDIEFKEKKQQIGKENFKKYNEKIKSGEIQLTETQIKTRSENLKKIHKNRTAEQQKLISLKSLYTRCYKDKFLTLEEFIEYKKINNHKIKNIEYLCQEEDVYDITVEKYNNFALAAGIFVHNCVGYNSDCIFFEDPSSFTRTYMSNIELEQRWHDMDDDNKTKIEHATVIIRGDKKYKHSEIVHMD